jgi:hypothetical protein
VDDHVATHATAWRMATEYPTTAPPRDPDLTDVTTSWAMVVGLLLLMPPLGWLQLRHRPDIDSRVRVMTAALSAVLVLAAWTTVLGLQPWS